jgi:hypothetical protein
MDDDLSVEAACRDLGRGSPTNADRPCTESPQTACPPWGTFPWVGKNVLVISTVEHADDVLRAHVGEAENVKVVVPVVRQGVLDWLANDQKAFARAERVAERTAEQLSGETVDAVAGEADVDLAIRDALATFPADEIVVAVRPEDEEGFVESSATHTAPQHRLEGVPVRFVVIGDS